MREQSRTVVVDPAAEGLGAEQAAGESWPETTEETPVSSVKPDAPSLADSGDATTAPPRSASDHPMIAWLARHPEVLEGYAEEWVAIADERVVSHGKSMDEVIRQAAAQGFEDPLLVPMIPWPFVSVL